MRAFILRLEYTSSGFMDHNELLRLGKSLAPEASTERLHSFGDFEPNTWAHSIYGSRMKCLSSIDTRSLYHNAPQPQSRTDPSRNQGSTTPIYLHSENVEGYVGFKDSPPRSPEWKPQRREWLIVSSIFLLYLMIALDSTIIVPVLPTIASELNGTAVHAFWAGTSFLLTYAVFQPFIAVLSDIFGRREVMLASVSLFTTGTLIACLAQNFSTLLAGRSIQGVGAGGVFVLGYVILTDIVPLRQRPKFTAIIQMAWAVGTILGPLFGGLFAEHSTWRWTLQRQESSFMDKIKQVDWIGGTLFITSTTLPLIAISWGGTQFAWDHMATFAPMLIGIFGLLCTIWYEFRIANIPFLRKNMFYCRSAIAAYICSLIQGLELYIALYYIPLYLQAVQGLSPVRTRISALLGNRGRMGSHNTFNWPPTTVGRQYQNTCLGYYPSISWVWAWLDSQCTQPRGSGHLNCQQRRPRSYDSLSDAGLPTEISKNAEAYIETLHNLPLFSPFKFSVIECYVKGIQGVFAVITGFSGLAMFLSFLIARHSTDKYFVAEDDSIEYEGPYQNRSMMEEPMLEKLAHPEATHTARSSDSYPGVFEFEGYKSAQITCIYHG
ncbi:MFS multidrug transporter [Blastomyces dermatitidis ATCC 18188]|uniref:MFS multidrug transporter n=1 Tax=Ajellomyces dermatitidis (strain ATCC 18188 / CBS 674.68) TaxID=653446 RepID=F2TEW7_AJEDA|nr:MFS multidrug transporter [Blastomyces dermatitidis ATCC 18188]